jgi:hypothetical protein
MDALIYSLILASIGFAVAMLARSAEKRILVTSAALFAIYLALDDYITGLPHLVPALHSIPGHWNWSGKVLSLVFSAIVIGSLRLSPDAVGLRKQEHPGIAWIAVGLFIV